MSDFTVRYKRITGHDLDLTKVGDDPIAADGGEGGEGGEGGGAAAE